VSLRCAPEPSASPSSARDGPAANAIAWPSLRSLGHSHRIAPSPSCVCPWTGPTPGEAFGATVAPRLAPREFKPGARAGGGRGGLPRHQISHVRRSRPRVRAEEPSLRRNLSSGRSAHARWPAAGPPARLETRPTNPTTALSIQSLQHTRRGEANVPSVKVGASRIESVPSSRTGASPRGAPITGFAVSRKTWQPEDEYSNR